MGTLASLDKQGRWAVAGNAFWNLASSPGPFIATLIASYSGYGYLAMWAFTTGTIGTMMFCYSGKQSDKLDL